MKLLQFAVLRYVPVLVLLMLAFRSHAQTPVFTITSEVAQPGSSTSVDVEVKNFVQIVGAQFSIEWDSSKLEYTGLSELALDASQEESFNLTRTDNGMLGYLYIDNTVQGVDLPDGTKLFRVHFNVAGSDGEQVEIGFGDTPVNREISDTSFTEIEVTYENGTVNIGETSATEDAVQADLRLQAAPNPFSESTRISWSTTAREPVRVVVLDVAGRIIRQFEHPRGADPVLTLQARDLPASGTYIIELHTQNGKTSHKVAFVKP